MAAADKMRAMSGTDVFVQPCPACGAEVDLSGIEPLSRTECPVCHADFRVQPVFDNFQVIESLGAGGMGSVYKARDLQLGRLVALKVLRREAETSGDQVAQLRQEARVTASINHPNVVRVYSSGTALGQFYIVMELVEGGSLDDAIEERKQLTEDEVLAWGIALARGLEAAHAAGLIHRDVKPANILFADATTPKLVDFGLAGLAEPGSGGENEIWGTPYYVAPERLHHQPEDHRSDIYSLGATLYHALAGRPPIEGETNSAGKLRELKEHPVDLGLVAPEASPGTVAAINRTLRPDPAERPSTYDELVGELKAAQRALGEARMEAAQRLHRRRRRLLIGVAVLLLLLLGGGIGFFLFSRAAEQKRVAAAAREEALAPLRAVYEQARSHLLAGELEKARDQFNRLAADPAMAQPLLNYIRLQEALLGYLSRRPADVQVAVSLLKEEAIYSLERAEETRAEFFLRTAELLDASPPISLTQAGAVPGEETSFALLLLGLHAAEAKEFGNARALLERFESSAGGQAPSWIAEYRPMARRYLHDLKLWQSLQDRGSGGDDVAGLQAQLELTRQMLAKLQTNSVIRAEIEGQAQRLTALLSEKEGAAAVEERKRESALREAEEPVWQAAQNAYAAAVKVYDFERAREMVAGPRLTVPALREEQAFALRKADWLRSWRQLLAADVARQPFPGPLAGFGGARFPGNLARVTADRLILAVPPYGSTELEWTQLPASTLLEIALSYAKSSAPDEATRQWLSAVFAAETGQPEAARQLAEKAAAADPAQADDLKRLFGTEKAP